MNNPVPILWDFVAAWRSFSLKARRSERTIIANDDGARRRVSVENRGEGYGRFGSYRLSLASRLVRGLLVHHSTLWR